MTVGPLTENQLDLVRLCVKNAARCENPWTTCLFESPLDEPCPDHAEAIAELKDLEQMGLIAIRSDYQIDIGPSPSEEKDLEKWVAETDEDTEYADHLPQFFTKVRILTQFVRPTDRALSLLTTTPH